jgi:large subunit ribosomal protein L24
MNRIKAKDTVMVMAGKEKGKVGQVLSVVDDGKRVVVEKVNVVKRHTKPSRESQYGGIVDKEAPLDVSNVALLTKDGKPTRVSFKFVEGADGKSRKVRYSRKHDEVLD